MDNKLKDQLLEIKDELVTITKEIDALKLSSPTRATLNQLLELDIRVCNIEKITDEVIAKNYFCDII
jgi:hypothetical protein